MITIRDLLIVIATSRDLDLPVSVRVRRIHGRNSDGTFAGADVLDTNAVHAFGESVEGTGLTIVIDEDRLVARAGLGSTG